MISDRRQIRWTIHKTATLCWIIAMLCVLGFVSWWTLCDAPALAGDGWLRLGAATLAAGAIDTIVLTPTLRIYWAWSRRRGRRGIVRDDMIMLLLAWIVMVGVTVLVRAALRIDPAVLVFGH